MNTYRRKRLLIATLFGAFGLLSMASFTTYNACKVANINTIYIKDQTQLAFKADDFKMVKYHAYKALTGIEKSKANFKNCGCDAALKSINRTKENLKSATKSSALFDAKSFVEIALKNTAISIDALENYKQNNSTASDENFLVSNAKTSNLITDNLTVIEGKTLSEKIENGVNKFKNSLDKMIAVNDCVIALHYVQTTHELSVLKSENENISPGKRHYHKRIKEITELALKDLKDCK